MKPGVDLHGFRAIAERSVLADQEKDSGAASVFPDLAEQWKQESSAQSDWPHVSEDRLQVLQAQYGVTWVLLENSAPMGASSVRIVTAICECAASWKSSRNCSARFPARPISPAPSKGDDCIPW